MADYEVEYKEQKAPPMSGHGWFIVFVDTGVNTYVKKQIFTDYNEAVRNKESIRTGIRDSFVRACDSRTDALRWIVGHKVWED